MLHLSLLVFPVMPETNNIFVNPSAIQTKIAGKLGNNTEQVSGKTKLLGVKHEQNTKVTERAKVPIFGLFLCL